MPLHQMTKGYINNLSWVRSDARCLVHLFLVRELSDEEKERIMASEDFQRFLDRSTRVVERAMSENVDIFVDYSGGDGDDEEM